MMEDKNDSDIYRARERKIETEREEGRKKG